MRAANLALRFLLELTALTALGWWGATVRAALPVRLALAVAAPLAAALFWGAFVAPRARVVLPTTVRMLLGLGVFALAAAALASRGEMRLALWFGGLAVANVALMLAWGQDRIVPQRPTGPSHR